MPAVYVPRPTRKSADTYRTTHVNGPKEIIRAVCGARRGHTFGVCASSRNPRFLFLGHMPDHDVVVGHVDSGMTRVKVEADVVSSAREPRRLEGLVILDVLYRDHINSRYQAIATIETQERTDRKGLALDVNDPQARKELREVHEVADALIPFLFGDLPLVRKRPIYVPLSASVNGCFGSRVLLG